MAHYFSISSDEDRFNRNRLLSYTGVVKGGKLILTLKVEVSSEMDFELAALEAIQRAHAKRAAQTATKAATRSPHLADTPPDPGSGNAGATDL